MTDSDFLTPKQAARFAEVDVSTVYRWIRSGVLPACRLGPHRFRIRRSDAEALLKPVTPAQPVVLPSDRARDAEEFLRRRGYKVGP